LKYQEFLQEKYKVAQTVGFTTVGEWAHLFPFQSAIVRWALKMGRAAIFADTGLGKTRMQTTWANEVALRTGGRVLILAPLAVASQTVIEADSVGIKVYHLRTTDDMNGMPESGVFITNYDRLHYFSDMIWQGVVLDESSILKSFMGATRQAIQAFGDTVPYRLACTATPAPNDHMELGTHAEFLAVMSRAEMLATYFVHDGGETQTWRLKKHAVKDFWKWVATWAVSCKMPSDLGFEDSGYELPKLTIVDHSVDDESFTKGMTLLGAVAQGLNDQRAARRSSLTLRVDACADIVNTEPDEQWIVWCGLNDEGDALTSKINGAVQVAGSDSPEHKERTMLAFSRGEVRVLVTKSSICGYGMNWQNCARQAFVGVDHSYESFYQAVRRSWRFGQNREVHAHVFYATTEGDVVRNLRRKEKDATKLGEEMVIAMKEFNDMDADSSRVRDEYSVQKSEGKGWELYRGDCVEVIGSLPADSVHYSIFSPPFASLYTYSNSTRDMGNCRSDQEFADHFKFLVPELYRVLMPGRLVSFHCMNLPTLKERDGYIGIRDFRGALIKAFEEQGFIYHSEVCIWKDPVTAMQRTKALGLLHKQIKKDSAMSRQGIPDYLVTMRKPGINPEPVTHTNESFPVHVWQRFASPVWMDINHSDTLQFQSARENDDERHICPLQLQVIRRAIQLWSNPQDLVLSPFTGIGSEGYEALRNGRRFIGAELKQSYYDVACRNLDSAVVESGQMNMTDMFGE
jgi:DNA modification methylase